MTIELWIDALQHSMTDRAGFARRRLSPDEVHKRVLDSRPGWLARELDRPEDEARIAAVLAANPGLDAALAPRRLDARRIGIVVDEPLLSRLSAALPAKSGPGATGPGREPAR